MKKKSEIKFDRRYMLLLIICICLLLGTAIGAVGANSMDELQNKELGGYLSGFFDAAQKSGELNTGSVLDSIIKYGKYIIMIWCCGLIAPGAIFIFIIIIFKGISYGFTTAFLVRQYSGSGVAFAATACLPQNIILIPLYISISYISIMFILDKYSPKSYKGRLKRETHKKNIEYLILLIVSILLVCVAGYVEVYLVPFFIKNLSVFGG